MRSFLYKNKYSKTKLIAGDSKNLKRSKVFIKEIAKFFLIKFIFSLARFECMH